MKKIILVLFLLILSLIVIEFFFSPPVHSPILVSPSPSSNPPLAQFGDYRYAWVKLDNLANLKLLPNHDAQISSEELAKINHCQILVNGNFYDENDRPLGWLVSQGKTISPPLVSNLFNGFLSLSTSKVESRISSSIPKDKVSLGLQSGPLLILDSKPLLLKINNDQPRRRIIAALNNQNELIFLVLTGAESLYSGPLLADTPKLVVALSQALNQNLVAALNLDGGSASAFHTPEVHLNEYAYIGSFFCYN
ncbi:MAG: phosphodiester glycosidase family protein [Patescibacteria group bacterium]|nr:phosphodiester glycosidase family protein [Patescibacteria group bacterium]